MVDVAVDRNVSEKVRDIIFNAIKSIREESKQRDTIFLIERITRNPTNFTEVELRIMFQSLLTVGF